MALEDVLPGFIKIIINRCILRMLCVFLLVTNPAVLLHRTEPDKVTQAINQGAYIVSSSLPWHAGKSAQSLWIPAVT